MNKTLLFSIGIMTVLIFSTIVFSINFSMVFSQNSNTNMIMRQWPMMKQMNHSDMMIHSINQTGMMGMVGPMAEMSNKINNGKDIILYLI
ncbi:MAG: hypothetical protein ACXWFB_07100 [Nitrososphaeraceae archaeon]